MANGPNMEDHFGKNWDPEKDEFLEKRKFKNKLKKGNHKSLVKKGVGNM